MLRGRHPPGEVRRRRRWSRRRCGRLSGSMTTSGSRARPSAVMCGGGQFARHGDDGLQPGGGEAARPGARPGRLGRPLTLRATRDGDWRPQLDAAASRTPWMTSASRRAGRPSKTSSTRRRAGAALGRRARRDVAVLRAATPGPARGSSADTSLRPLTTLETVATETPADAATVGQRGPADHSLDTAHSALVALGRRPRTGVTQPPVVPHDAGRPGEPNGAAAGQVGGRAADEHLDLAGLDDPRKVPPGEGRAVGVQRGTSRRPTHRAPGGLATKPASWRTGRVTWATTSCR